MFRNWLRSIRQAIRSLEPKPFDTYAVYAPRVAAALSRRGYNLCLEGDLEGALQAFNEALVYAPKSAVVFNNRACAFLEQCEYDRAIQDCNTALGIDPALASAFCNRGSAHLGKLDLQQGAEDYDRCLSLDPNYSVAYSNRSFVSLVAADFERAVQDCDHAITLDPSYSLAHRNRGAIAFCQGRFGEAEKHLGVAAELDPKAPEIGLWLHLAQLRTAEPEASELNPPSAILDLTKWPGPLVSLLSGSAEEQTVLSATKDPNPDKERGQLCGAYFVIGEKALINDDRERARLSFRKSLETGAINYLECSAAKAELDRLDGVTRDPKAPNSEEEPGLKEKIANPDLP